MQFLPCRHTRSCWGGHSGRWLLRLGPATKQTVGRRCAWNSCLICCRTFSWSGSLWHHLIWIVSVLQVVASQARSKRRRDLRIPILSSALHTDLYSTSSLTERMLTEASTELGMSPIDSRARNKSFSTHDTRSAFADPATAYHNIGK